MKSNSILFSEKKKLVKYNPSKYSSEWELDFEYNVYGISRIDNYVFVTTCSNWGTTYTSLVEFDTGKKLWTLKEIFYKAKLYKIEYEGIKREVSAFAIVFANASQYGNDARIAPNAKEDNGFIDFVIIKKFPHWKIPLFLIDVMNGKTHLNENVEIIRTKKMKIESNLPMVHLDGEIKNLSNPIEIKSIHKNFKVFVPNEK